MASDPTAVTKLYEQLPLQAMQQAHDSYMAWYVDRVTGELDKTIAGLRSELRDNDAKEASYRPSPNELSAIERLQRSGVTGVDLLDHMVEQGDDWLMLTMRRLDHFERTGLAPKDYSTWCEHALGGAYDWIDHDRLGSGGGGSAPAARSGGGSERNGRSPRPEENPTAPVASVASNWNGGGSSGASSSGAGYYSQPGQPGQQGQPAEDDGKGRRNVFKIFTN